MDPKPLRKAYPSDVSDEEWLFCRNYLELMREDAPQREYASRELFNALRYMVRAGCPWRMLPHDLPPWSAVYQQAQRWMQAGCFEAMAHDLRAIVRLAGGRKADPSAAVLDGRTMQSTPESVARAGYDGYKRRKGSKVHAAVDTLGHLLALKVTPAHEQERAQAGELVERLQEVTADSIKVAYADQGYTGGRARATSPGTRCGIACGQAQRGKEGLCAAAAPLGGGALLCLGGAVSPLGP